MIHAPMRLSGYIAIGWICLAEGMSLCGQPYIRGNGVLNVASYMAPALPGGAIAQGSAFAIFGTGLGPATGIQVSRFPLQATFQGVSIKVFQGAAGVAALPIYVSATQINAVMPSNAPLGRVSVQVTYNGQAGNPAPATIAQPLKFA